MNNIKLQSYYVDKRIHYQNTTGDNSLKEKTIKVLDKDARDMIVDLIELSTTKVLKVKGIETITMRDFINSKEETNYDN